MLFLFCEPAIIFVENPSQAATSISYFPGMYSLFTADGGSSSEPFIITLLREFLTGEELLCVKDLWRLFFLISSVNLSPSVSDTTVMSSAGAQSNHINHVTTQMQYAAVVAVVCIIGYIIAGLVQIWWVALGISLMLLLAVLTFIKKRSGSNREKTAGI